MEPSNWISSLSSIFKSSPASAFGLTVFTLIAMLSDVDPPKPVHLRVKVLLAVILSIVSDPDVSLAPDHPPEAAQVWALVEVQVKVADPWQETEPGPARSTVGLSVPQSFEQLVFVSPQSELHFPSPQK